MPLLLGAAACSNGSATPAAAPYPTGTVLAVDGLAISAAEVDDAGRWVAVLEPAASENHRRRLALDNLVLLRAVCRTRFPEEREAARALALEWTAHGRGERALLPAGAAGGPAPPPITVRGGAVDLGPFLWGPASELPLDTWSEPIELVGRFMVTRVVGREPGRPPGSEVLSLECRELPYVPEDSSTANVLGWMDAATLEVVDPLWEDVVSLDSRTRMRGAP